MKTYLIEETAIYEVEADSPEEAEKVFLASENPSEFLSYIEDRQVVPHPEDHKFTPS